MNGKILHKLANERFSLHFNQISSKKILLEKLETHAKCNHGFNYAIKIIIPKHHVCSYYFALLWLNSRKVHGAILRRQLLVLLPEVL